MLRFKDFSVKSKLMLVITATTCFVLVLAAAALVIYEVVSFRERLVDHVGTLAQVVGSNCTSPLAFEDRGAAEAILGSLAAEPPVVAAVLYTADGKMLGRYQRREGWRVFKTTPGEDGHRFEDGHLILSRKILLAEDPVGTLVLVSDTHELAERLTRYGVTAGVILIAAILAALLVSSKAQRVVSGPILELAAAARRISSTDGERVRVSKHGNDEVGLLTDSFNEMAAGIESREQALQEAHDDLAQYIVRLEGEISVRQRTEVELHKLSLAVRHSPAAVVIMDTQSTIEYVNPKFEQLTGYAAGEVVGQNFGFLRSGHVSTKSYDEIWANLRAGREWRGEFHSRKKDGGTFWEFASFSPITAEDGSITHFLAINEDITVRKEHEERILRQATFDHLTGLPNRVLAFDRLSSALRLNKRWNQLVAVMFVDLDNFKKINDTLGHAAGDELLVETANRLSECIRDSDTVARLGGDEFLIILSGLPGTEVAEKVSRQILAKVAEPFSLQGNEVFVTTSIGITIAPEDGTDPHALMRNADAAMYRAKDDGRNTYRFFTPSMNEEAVRRLRIESNLRQALARNELSLVYQPIVDCQSGAMAGAEALLRWHNAELGQVPPDVFIPVAEDTGLIVSIGTWVLQTACAEAESWRELDKDAPYLTVNVSPRQFRGGGLENEITMALEASGLSPKQLVIEVTESLLTDGTEATVNTLEGLNRMGVRLMIDDFGTGYSSLSYLKQFRFDGLKIDRSFLRGVSPGSSDAKLISAIIAMSFSLGLDVVAEGIETKEQLDFVRSQGCDMSQGFYFSKPLPVADFRRLLTKGKPEIAAGQRVAAT